MKFLLDTNVIKEVGKASPHQNVGAWLDTVDDLDLAISVISVREIVKGIERKRKSDSTLAAKLETAAEGVFLAFADRTIDVDFAIAKLWGTLLGQSEKDIEDTGLAATARVHGLTVVTRNEDDFRNRGAEVLNPFKKLGKSSKTDS